MMYAQDWDEVLPQAGLGVSNFGEPGAPPNYLGSIFPYIRSHAIFYCPSSGVNPGLPCTETSCSSYRGSGVVLGRPLSAIPTPSEVVYLHEFIQRANLVMEDPVLVNPDTRTYLWLRGGLNMHTGGQNLVFVDGHAHYRKGDRSGYYGLTPDQLPSDSSMTQRFTAAF